LSESEFTELKNEQNYGIILKFGQQILIQAIKVRLNAENEAYYFEKKGGAK